MNVVIKRLREFIFLCTCLKIDGHIYQHVALTFLRSIVPKEMYDSATNVIFQEMKKTICAFICSSVIIWGVLNKMQVL